MVGLAKMGLGDQCVCLLCVEGNSHINMSPARELWSNKIMAIREIKEEEEKNGWLAGRMVLGKHYHPPRPSRNLISFSLFRNGGCGGRPCQPKNVHSISNTSSDHPYVHTPKDSPLSHSSHQKWEGNTLGNLDR